jgi:methylmalonyl-CoA mutase N-terminal domain/subunit
MGYRQVSWMKRQVSGFGLPEDSNRRQKELLAQGQEGYGGQATVMLTFDYPSNYGYDSDHPLAQGQVGKTGVVVDSLEDMERLFQGLPVESMHTVFIIDAPAPIVLAMYVAYAESLGIERCRLRGSISNNTLGALIGNNMYVFPPRPGLRLMMDMVAFCTREMPLWNTVNLIGINIRESGATAVQEVAFDLAMGLEVVRAGLEMGLKVDDFAPRLSFHFGLHRNFFEEICKIRAARRLWARIMRERFGAQQHRSCMMRMLTQTCGSTLTYEEPMNNIARVALGALAAILAGTQALATASYDEVYAIPTDAAQRVALRTQQIIQYETGVADVVDPLGGSYYVEWLTDRLEREVLAYLDRIEKMGGYVAAVEQGFIQREVARASLRHQQEVETGQQVIVGVNRYRSAEQAPVEVFEHSDEVERTAVERLRRLRARRHAGKTTEALARIRRAAQEGDPLMPLFIEAVKAQATMGEIMAVLKDLWGQGSREPVLTGTG